MMGEDDDLENTILETRSLAKRRRLDGGERKRFKELVAKLKRGGFGPNLQAAQRGRVYAGGSNTLLIGLIGYR